MKSNQWEQKYSNISNPYSNSDHPSPCITIPYYLQFIIQAWDPILLCWDSIHVVLLFSCQVKSDSLATPWTVACWAPLASEACMKPPKSEPPPGLNSWFIKTSSWELYSSLLSHHTPLPPSSPLKVLSPPPRPCCPTKTCLESNLRKEKGRLMDSMGGGRDIFKHKDQGIQNDKHQRKATHLAGNTFSQIKYICL